jgi:hypothetical protein
MLVDKRFLPDEGVVHPTLVLPVQSNATLHDRQTCQVEVPLLFLTS